MSHERKISSTISERGVKSIESGYIHVNGAAHAAHPGLANSFDPTGDLDAVADKHELDLRQASDHGDHDMHIDDLDFRTSDTLLPLPGPPASYAPHASFNAPNSTEGISHVPQPQAMATKNSYDASLNRIDDQRWTLRDQRESLHGGRVRLNNQRQSLRETRAKTMMYVDTAFRFLKQYWPGLPVELPQDVGQAYEDAGLWNAKLEQQETEFRRAEEAYDMDEWIYTEQESKFVDDLYTSEPFVQSGGLTRHASGDSGIHDFSANVEEIGSPTSLEACSPNEAYAHLLAPAQIPRRDYMPLPPSPLGLSHYDAFDADEDAQDLYSGFDEGEGDGVASISAKHQSKGRSTQVLDSTLERSMTSKSLDVLPSKLTKRLIPRPYSENDLTQVKLDWSDTRVRIEEWLLEALEQSALQKDLLRQFFGNDALDFHTWWDLVVQHWKSDSSDDDVFHTGDTTVPPTTTGRRTSIIDVRDVQVISEEDTPETAIPLVSPLISLDRVLDSLDAFDFPTDIKHIDLVGPSGEATPEEVIPSIETRIPPPHAASMYDVSALQDMPEYENIPNKQQIVPATSEAEPVDTDVFSDHGSFSIPPHIGSPDFTSDQRRTMDHHTTSISYSATRRTFSESSSQSLTPSQGTVNRPVPYVGTHPEATVAPGWTLAQQTSPLYIQVRDSSTWYLPLLRLTPNEASQTFLPQNTRPTADTESRALPFVSHTNSILRLPGPAPLC